MKKWNIQLRGKTAEILLYGDIGDEFDGVTARGLVEDLKQLSVSEINLRINSAGGSAFEGIAIYNALMRHPSRIVVDIDGMALSAASLVAMAGNPIRMADNSTMMIHEPWNIAIGTAADLRKTAEMLESLRGNARDIYAKRSRRLPEDIESMMADETWMSAHQALELGFADEITGAMKVAAYVPKDRFHKVPARLASRTIESYKAEVAKRWKAHTGKQK